MEARLRELDGRNGAAVGRPRAEVDGASDPLARVWQRRELAEREAAARVVARAWAVMDGVRSWAAARTEQRGWRREAEGTQRVAELLAEARQEGEIAADARRRQAEHERQLTELGAPEDESGARERHPAPGDAQPSVRRRWGDKTKVLYRKLCETNGEGKSWRAAVAD